MLYPLALTALGTTLFTSAIAAQEFVPASVTRVQTPVTSVAPSSRAEPAAREAAPTPVVELDEQVTVLDITVDDNVPLPNAGTVKASDAGDTQLTEASGDPFFLGFAGESYYPPSDEILDPALIEAASFPHPDGRVEAVTYGFVMFSKRITKKRVEELKELGVRVLGFHPHYNLRVALPTDAMGAVSTLDFVRWVGVARQSQKLHPALEAELDMAPVGEPVKLYVSVFESDLNDASTSTGIGRVDVVDEGSVAEVTDGRLTQIWQSNGWMHAALEEMGASILSYSPRLHTFQVQVDQSRIEALIARDFVQFVEPIGRAETLCSPSPHDESRAMIASDRVVNSFDGGTNQVAIVGVVDSGIESSHMDLGMAGVGWNCTTQTSSWDDISNGGNGHGTHVTASILGRGVSEADHKGNAPGLASWGGTSRLFNYRRFPNPCNVDLDAIAATFGSPFTSGPNTTARPHIVNNSWGSTIAGIPSGTEFDARAADTAVFDQDQLWVWSAGNSGPGVSTLGIQSSAKNVLTVGNSIDYRSSSSVDTGSVWTDSSRGPTAEGRWKPNLNAPGRWIRSAVANDSSGYANYWGTSMAAPHVTAAAALIVDRSASYRYAPERLMSLLMASATSKDDTSYTTPTHGDLNSYGAGRVNAFKANFNFGGNTFSNWGFELNGNQATGANFTVPVGTDRIVVVMAGLEEAASSGASAALINDYDLYLDRDPIDPAGNTGEYFAQQSTIDNCEIRTVNSPQAGPWRWKVYPDGATSLTKLSVTVYYVADDTTPDATLTVTGTDQYIQPGEDVDVSAQVNSDDYVASAVNLDKTGHFATIEAQSTVLGDGTVTDLLDRGAGGDNITLGDVIDFYPRTGTWTVNYASEGVKTFGVTASSDNMVDKSAAISITVDGTQPGLVSGLSSPTHTVGAWSTNQTIQWNWNTASDNLSGIDGYGIYEATIAGSPSSVLDIGAVTSFTSSAYPSSPSPRFFNIRSVDRSGNWDLDYASIGPFFIDVANPVRPAGLVSTTHPVGSSRCERSIQLEFSPGSDGDSGVDGYSILWSTSASSNPNTTVEQSSATVTRNLPLGTWYMHVRTIDNAGNASGTSHFGPFTITSDCGQIYCNSNSNSSGATGTLRAQGTDTRATNNLTVHATQLPTNTLGYFLVSNAPGFVANPAGSQGNLCLSGNVGRYSNTVLNSGGGGTFSLPLNLAAVPTPTGSASVSAGSSWHWQAWFRDANPGVTSNFTDGVVVTFY